MPAPAAEAIQFAFGYRFPSRGIRVDEPLDGRVEFVSFHGYS